MLTFKLADELKKDSIQVNAVEISRIKISKETIKKFKPMWRIAARLQNMTNPLPETMANTYYEICTSEAFKDITGKLINDQRAIVKPSHYSKGFIQEAKQLFDKGVYPKYADNIEHIEGVWELCVKLTGDYMKGSSHNS